jgi:hypothetical protein
MGQVMVSDMMATPFLFVFFNKHSIEKNGFNRRTVEAQAQSSRRKAQGKSKNLN